MTTPIEWPEPVLSVPFASQTIKVYQGDYYNADQVLKLISKYNDLVAADRKRIADLERELAEARRDAERYRFLVNCEVDLFSVPGGHVVVDWIRGWDVTKEQLDAAIDGVMGTEP